MIMLWNYDFPNTRFYGFPIQMFCTKGFRRFFDQNLLGDILCRAYLFTQLVITGANPYVPFAVLSTCFATLIDPSAKAAMNQPPKQRLSHLIILRGLVVL